MYFITYPTIPITWPTAILNLPINLFYPPDTVLVLNLFSIHPLNSSYSLLWWLLLKTVTWHHLYCVFTFTLFWLTKTSMSVKKTELIFFVVFICSFFMSFIWRPLHFLVKVIHFYSLFLFFVYKQQNCHIKQQLNPSSVKPVPQVPKSFPNAKVTVFFFMEMWMFKSLKNFSYTFVILVTFKKYLFFKIPYVCPIAYVSSVFNPSSLLSHTTT
jgi:hypothetical protein